MKPEQKAIYYITGENEQNLRNSPLLEAYKDKDIEVFIMDEDIDEIVIPSIGKYKDVDLKPVNRSDAADDLKTEEDKKSEKKIDPLIKKIKKVLGDEVKDVRASARLSDSPSCIVADEKDPTIQMQHLLKSMGQTDMPEVKPILEINPGHEIVQKLVGSDNDEATEDAGRLLLDQALLLEGVQLKDPSGFVKRLNKVLTKSL
jgi:molecular chaperone HtpG